MSTPLAELRALNVRKQREAQADASPQTDNQASQSYDNMTSHTTDQEEIPLSDQTTSKPTRKRAVGQVAPSSVVQAIKATVRQAGDETPTLKTVTIKLAPSLDRRVEEHCFATGHKKQDVVRDALLLYFETVEAIERGEA